MLLEIEIDNADNADLFFPPMQRPIRGRLDFLRVKEKEARGLMDSYPQGIPGQRIAFDDASGEGAIVEPLQLPEHAAVKSKLEKLGYGIPPATEPIEKPHRETWLFWLKRAVESGHARLTKGKIPEGDFPNARRRFFSADPEPDPRDATIQKLTALLYAKLTPAEKKTFDEIK